MNNISPQQYANFYVNVKDAMLKKGVPYMEATEQAKNACFVAVMKGQLNIDFNIMGGGDEK